MPHTYSICVPESLVRVTCSGPGSLEEGARVLQEVADDPKFVPGYGLLVDVRECTAQLTPKEVTSFSAFLKAVKRFNESRMAIVTTNVLYYGFGRMMSALTDTGGIAVKVFKDIDEAVVWVSGG